MSLHVTLSRLPLTHGLNQLLLSTAQACHVELEYVCLDNHSVSSLDLPSRLFFTAQEYSVDLLKDLKSVASEKVLVLNTEPSFSESEILYAAGVTQLLYHPLSQTLLVNLLRSFSSPTSSPPTQELDPVSPWEDTVSRFAKLSSYSSALCHDPLGHFCSALKKELGIYACVIVAPDQNEPIIYASPGLPNLTGLNIPLFTKLGRSNIPGYSLKNIPSPSLRLEMDLYGFSYYFPLQFSSSSRGFVLFSSPLFIALNARDILRTLLPFVEDLAQITAGVLTLREGQRDSAILSKLEAAGNFFITQDATGYKPSNQLELSPEFISALHLEEPVIRLSTSVAYVVIPVNNSKKYILDVTRFYNQLTSEKQHALLEAHNQIFLQFSHVLNNAYTDLSTATQLFTSESLSDPEFIKFLSNTLIGSTQRLLRPMQQLKDWCLLDTPVPLETIVIDTWLKSLLSSNGLFSGVTCTVPTQKVTTHLKTLEILVSEILRNAVQTEKPVKITSDNIDGNFYLCITDQGPGLSNDNIELAKAGKGIVSARGLGLGLAMSFRAAALLHTQLLFRTSSSGTEAYIRLN
jgi:signal transduction histidine kinase